MSTPPEARLRPYLTYPPWAVLLGLALLYPLFPAPFDRFQFYPFVFGMVVLGLPHGAMDHLVMARLEGRPVTWRYLLPFFAGYGALVGAFWVFWHGWPAGALGVFLVLSWLHWGQGDFYFLRAFAGRCPPRTPQSLLVIWAVRGALPIVLPPLLFPRVFQSVAQGITGWFGPATAWALTPALRAVGLGVFGLLLLVYVYEAWRDNGRRLDRVFWGDVGEVGLLLFVFARVPPILAVGVYFCLWHSARHLARLALSDPESGRDLAAGRTGKALLRTAGECAPLTAAALALLALLYWTQGRAAASVGDFVYFYLSWIAALTFPHFLIVLWMDGKQGLLWGSAEDLP